MDEPNLAMLLPGEYSADGSYGFSETGLRLPFRSSFNVELSPHQLCMRGRVRQHTGRQTYPFTLTLARDKDSQSQAEVTVALDTLVTVTGRVALVGPTVELLAYDLESNSVLSARVVPLDRPRIYEISGFLSLHGLNWFPFWFRVIPAEPHLALENVVGIESRRRK